MIREIPSEGGSVRDGAGRSSLTAGAVARLVGGTLVGQADTRIDGVAPLERAGAHDLSFFASSGYTGDFARSRAGAVLVSPKLARTEGQPVCRILVEQPYEAMLRVLPELYPESIAVPVIHSTAVIGRGARLGRDVTLGPHVVVGAGAVLGDRTCIGEHSSVGREVTIGADCRLYPSVVLYSGTQLGDRVRLHAGVRLGSDGFGYVYRNEAHQKMPHVGRCIIENDVEIGANTTVDRGSIDDTVIGAGTKIDNLVHIAHNVRVGRLCLIMAQTGIAGSTHIGDGCVLAGQVGVGGHVRIGAGSRIAARAGVFGNVPPGETWSGYPARPHKESLRAHAAMFKLSGLIRRLERLVESRDQ